LFMSIRIAASAAQVRQVFSGPRGARTVRAGEVVVVMRRV
jgi:hypothetical protein